MNIIRENRIKKKITQEKLAELIDVSPRQMQRIENNESSTKISTLRKIIKELEISNDDIIKIIKEDWGVLINK